MLFASRSCGGCPSPLRLFQRHGWPGAAELRAAADGAGGVWRVLAFTRKPKSSEFLQVAYCSWHACIAFLLFWLQPPKVGGVCEEQSALLAYQGLGRQNICWSMGSQKGASFFEGTFLVVPKGTHRKPPLSSKYLETQLIQVNLIEGMCIPFQRGSFTFS